MRKGFLALADEYPDRFRIIDGDRTPETVADEARQITDNVLSTPRTPA